MTPQQVRDGDHRFQEKYVATMGGFCYRVPTPKPVKIASNITIKESKIFNTPRKSEAEGDLYKTLADKIEEYILKLGYSNSQTLGIVVQVLTQGKVRVDFRDHTERLQLFEEGTLFSRTEAVDIFDKHIENMKKSISMGDVASTMTQRIVIQSPRSQKPSG